MEKYYLVKLLGFPFALTIHKELSKTKKQTNKQKNLIYSIEQGNMHACVCRSVDAVLVRLIQYNPISKKVGIMA